MEKCVQGNRNYQARTKHTKSCHGQFNWLHSRTLGRFKNLRERKIREFLEINNLELKTEFDDTMNVLNRD